jgi:hypothetical protein
MGELIKAFEHRSQECSRTGERHQAEIEEDQEMPVDK